MKDSAETHLAMFAIIAVALACVLLASGCASTPRTVVYAMPGEPSRALHPADADPRHPGELAESALHLLDPERPGGPDPAAAARMCLLAAELADPREERKLRSACYRLAARAALRSGDRGLYLEAVDTWERNASRAERTGGELSTHLSLRNRLRGESGGRIPGELARFLTPPGEVGAER